MTADSKAPPDAAPGPDAAPASDASVIRLSLKDPERFAELFRRHAPRIQRYVTRRLGVDAADDIVAETFLLAFRGRAAYDQTREDALPWLYGIATNLAGQHRRGEARQYRITQRAVAEPEVPDHADRVAAGVTAQAMRALLDAALAALPAGDRDVLLLIAWEQLTYQEVSRALAIPAGTVRSRLHRARAKVRQVLAGTDAAATYEELTTNE